jgi:hypothetical protein
MVKLEIDYINKMFEMGDVEGISSNDLKHFIKKRTNEKLVELGYIDLGDISLMTKKQQLILIGFTILPVGSLILIFSLLGQLITQKLTKVKTSKTSGKLGIIVTNEEIYSDLYN